MSKSPHKYASKDHGPITGDKNNFSVKVSYSFSMIRLNMLDKDTQERYNLTITQENIDKNPTLHLIYGNTESLFLDMKENFNQIFISEEAVISIEINLQMLGRNSKKTVKFYPVKCESLDMTEI